MEWTSLLVAGGVARWPDLSWSAWAVATSALLAAAYLMWSWSRFVRLIEALPGPRGVPLLGVTFDVEHDHAARIQQTHRRWVERYGPIYRAWIGPVVMVAIASPQLMEPILSSPKLITKGFGYSFLRAWLGDAIFLSTGRSWKDRRRMLTPAFHFQILQQFVDTFNEHSRAFCRQLQRWIDDRGADQPFDAYPVVTQCALDIICETSMGEQARSSHESRDYLHSLHRILQIGIERACRPWLLNDFAFGLSALGRENRRCVASLHDFTNRVIRDRRRSLQRAAGDADDASDAPKQRLAFLDLLLKAADDGAELSDDEIRQEVDVVMFAGHDTTAATMTWFLHCISLHPDEQEKLFDELDRVFGDDTERPCTMQDCSQLKYLECCIKETLRLYPSAPFVARRLTEDVQIGEYLLPAGLSVALLIYGMHRNPLVYAEPDEFRPERFLPENSVGRHPYAFVPFSAGPRNCIGQKYGMIEVKIVLSTLLRRFRFTAPAGITALLPPSSEVVLKPIDGVPVVAHRRTIE